MNETLRVVENRPKTTPIVAAFLFFATAIASIVGVSLLFPNRLLEPLWKLNPEGAVLFHSIGPVSGVFLLALAMGTLGRARTSRRPPLGLVVFRGALRHRCLRQCRQLFSDS